MDFKREIIFSEPIGNYNRRVRIKTYQLIFEEGIIWAIMIWAMLTIILHNVNYIVGIVIIFSVYFVAFIWITIFRYQQAYHQSQFVVYEDAVTPPIWPNIKKYRGKDVVIPYSDIDGAETYPFKDGSGIGLVVLKINDDEHIYIETRFINLEGINKLIGALKEYGVKIKETT